MNTTRKQPNYQTIDNLTQQVKQLQIENQQLHDLLDTLKFFINKFDKSGNKELESLLAESEEENGEAN